MTTAARCDAPDLTGAVGEPEVAVRTGRDRKGLADVVWSAQIANSVIVPSGVIRPIWPAFHSVNQRLPSGPAAIPEGWLFFVGVANSVISPAVVMRPILSLFCSVNQSA